MLQQIPEQDRTRPVFHLQGRQGRYGHHLVSKTVSRIGKAAGVKVLVDPRDSSKVKFASAHDLRRAFGERWAARVMPAQLMELMRHESIDTTHDPLAEHNARVALAWLGGGERAPGVGATHGVLGVYLALGEILLLWALAGFSPARAAFAAATRADPARLLLLQRGVGLVLSVSALCWMSWPH